MSSSKISSRVSNTGQSNKSGRGAASSVASGSTGTGSKKTSSQHKRNSSSSSENASDDELDAEDSLESQLVPCLASCSRQKMRAIHMALKRLGNNDNRISSKDFYAILTNEYGIKFTPRVVQIIQETFEDNQGIQFEKIFKCMEGAHQRTGRDSVDAALARNDLQTRKTTKTVQEWTEELISRIEEQVSRADVFLDFEDLRGRMNEKDVDKSGLLSKPDLIAFCNEPSFPVYGALLNAIIKHCESDAEHGRIKWQDFADLLERGQNRFTTANPDMRRASSKAPKGGIIKGSGDQAAPTKKKATVKMSLEGGGDDGGSSTVDDSASGFSRSMQQPLVPIPSNAAGEESASDAFDAQGLQKDDSKIGGFPVMVRRRTWGHDELSDAFKHLLAPKHHEHHGETSDGDEAAEATKPTKHPPPLQHHILKEKEQHQQRRHHHNHHIIKLQHAIRLGAGSHHNRHRGSGGGHHHGSSDAGSNDGHLGQHRHSSIHTATVNSKSGPNHVRLLLDESTWEEAKTDLHGKNQRVLPPHHKSHNHEHGEHPHPHQHQTNNSSSSSKPPQQSTVHVLSGQNIETQVQVYRPRDNEGGASDSESSHGGNLRERLHLNWVYGCRGNDCRNNLHIVSSGELAYFIANIVILYNPFSHTQRFYRGHSDEIKCMGVNSKRTICATGQNGYDETVEYKPSKQACIRVWRSESLETISVLGGGMMVKSILSIAFHPEKDVVAAVDAGPSKYVCLWDFNKGTCLTSCQIKVELICDMAFNPKMPELFVTAGKDHLVWWKIHPEMGTFNYLNDANFQGSSKPKYIICMTHSDKGDLVTGDSSGNICVWSSGTNVISNQVKQAHEGSIYCVFFARGSLLSSGRDGMVCNWQWPNTLEKVGELKLPDSEGAARTIVAKERHLIFGTTTNSILTAPMTPGNCPLSGARLNATPVTQGHFDALHGLAIPGVGNFFLTAGADGILLLFDASKCRPIFKYVVPEGGIVPISEAAAHYDPSDGPKRYENFIACDISSDVRTLALGTKDATLIVLRLLPSGELVQEYYETLSVVKISIIRFNSLGDRFAVGSSKGEIHIFGRTEPYSEQSSPATKDVWETIGMCHQPGTAPPFGMTPPLAVTSIDWTSDPINDCYFIRVTFHNTEYAIYNANTSTQINPIEAADYHWASNTCLLAWDRTGIFEHKNTRETGIRQVDVHPVRHSCMVVSDYTTSKMNLFKYPCTKPDTVAQSYSATLEISTLRFTGLGDFVITVGGKDSSILQWKVS